MNENQVNFIKIADSLNALILSKMMDPKSIWLSMMIGVFIFLTIVLTVILVSYSND